MSRQRVFRTLPVLVALAVTCVAVPFAPAATGEDWSAVGAPDLLRRTPRGFEPLPMLAMRVELDVQGVMLRGRIEQRFENSTGEVIEALYVLPLPEHAAVHAMTLAVGSRRIVAQVRETEAARRDYQAARREGRKAALVTERRPNLFRVAVANINPGETVSVELEFIEEVELLDGTYSVRMPLTLTPRFDPRHTSAAHAPRGRADTEVVAIPRVELVARLTPGFPLEEVTSPSHAIDVHWQDATWVATTSPRQVAADRDLVLNWRPLPTAEPQAALLVGQYEDDWFGLLMAQPRSGEGPAAERIPTATVLVLDVSGSMQGRSIETARQALLSALDRLRPGDRFDIVAFSDRLATFAPGLAPALAEDVDTARAWVGALEADGGTMIAPALEEALRLVSSIPAGDPASRRVILLTDAAVANEADALRAVAGRLGGARLHVVGIGSAPNAWLVRELAESGRGLAAFLADPAAAASGLDDLLERIARPQWTDLSVDWRGAPIRAMSPARLPDLYPGQPLVASLRLDAPPPAGRLILAGRVAGRTVHTPVRVVTVGDGDALAVRWARARVRALLDARHRQADPDDVRRRVVALGRAFSLVTPFTSLVAVEEFPSAEGPARAVRVPNGRPDGQVVSLPQTASLGPLLVRSGLAMLALGLALLVGAGVLERRFPR